MFPLQNHVTISAQEPVVQEVQDVQPIPDQGQATPSDPAGPPTFFNPSDVSATNSAPTFFNPASLPSIPEAGVRNGAAYGINLNRKLNPYLFFLS